MRALIGWSRALPRALHDRARLGVAYLVLEALVAALFVSNRSSGTTAAWHGLPLDDAWIHLVYARSAAALEPFAYNPGQLEAGATSPLWSFLLVPLFWLRHGLDFPVAVAVKIVGVVLSATAASCAHVTADRLGPRGAGVVAGVLVALDPTLAFAAVSGMEVPLASALLLGALAASAHGRRDLALVLGALAPVARPEAIPVVVALGVFVAHAEHGWRRALPVAMLGPSLAWSAACASITGHPLPTTFYVKHHPHSFLAAVDDAPALLGSLVLRTPAAGLGVGLGVAVLGIVVARRRDETRALATLCATGAALFLGGVVWAHDLVQPDAFYWARYALPGVALLAVPTAIGLAELGARAREAWRAEARVRAVLLGALAAAPLLVVPPAMLAATERYAWNCQNIEEMNVAAGRFIATHAPPGAWVAANDAGAIRYFGHHPVLDLEGLNDHRGAFGSREARVREIGPAVWAVMTGAEPEIATSPALETALELRTDRYTICECDLDTMVVRFRRE